MAKEIAIGKRAKISQAQQYMILSVLGASIVLGIAIAMVIHFIKLISFNAKIIIAEDQSIVSYSNVIKSIGICKKPNGAVYSDSELRACNPDSIEISEIPGTLRANILENIAANEALASVPKEDDTSCINPETEKYYTYKELNKLYDNAEGAEQLNAASQLIKKCSALRVIPDALPSFKNEEALLASLNKLFLISGREPESLSPSGTISASDIGKGLNAIQVSLSLDEATTEDTTRLLNNIERSIREFNIESAIISWSGPNTLSIRAQATSFYMDEPTIFETEKKIMPEGN